MSRLLQTNDGDCLSRAIATGGPLCGYISEGIAGYCFPDAVAGMVPLYRYWKGSVRDHLYTTNAAEIGTMTCGQVGNYRYRSEGVACYVIPYNG